MRTTGKTAVAVAADLFFKSKITATADEIENTASNGSRASSPTTEPTSPKTGLAASLDSRPTPLGIRFQDALEESIAERAIGAAQG